MQRVLVRPSALVRSVIGSAIEVHRTLGPGLLESVYESCLAEELAKRNVAFRRQVAVQVVYKGTPIDYGYRADLIVEDELLLELKSVERLLPIHTSQVLTYLKLIDLHQGLIINFNVRRLSHGLKNVLR